MKKVFLIGTLLFNVMLFSQASWSSKFYFKLSNEDRKSAKFYTVKDMGDTDEIIFDKDKNCYTYISHGITEQRVLYLELNDKISSVIFYALDNKSIFYNAPIIINNDMYLFNSQIIRDFIQNNNVCKTENFHQIFEFHTVEKKPLNKTEIDKNLLREIKVRN